MSLTELRPRHNRRSLVGMRSFKDTPQIHLIIPMSVVINRWTSSVTTGQVLIPYTSTFLINMLKPFPLSFVWVAQLERIGNNSWNAFHEETIHVEGCVRTATTKIFEGGFNMKTAIPDVNFLKGCNSSRYNLTGIFTAHEISVLSKISYFQTLTLNPQITRSA